MQVREHVASMWCCLCMRKAFHVTNRTADCRTVKAVVVYATSQLLARGQLFKFVLGVCGSLKPDFDTRHFLGTRQALWGSWTSIISLHQLNIYLYCPFKSKHSTDKGHWCFYVIFTAFMEYMREYWINIVSIFALSVIVWSEHGNLWSFFTRLNT